MKRKLNPEKHSSAASEQEKRKFLFESRDGHAKAGAKQQKQCQISTNFTLVAVNHQGGIDDSENSETRRETSSSRNIAQVAYPYRKPSYLINYQYRPHFEYIHHIDQRKILLKCKVKSIDSQENSVLTEKECCQTMAILEGNYGNLKRHLQGVHKKKMDDVSMERKDSSGQPPQAYDRNNNKQRQFDECVLEMFAEGLSFSFPRKRSFKKTIKLLDPRITVKSRQAYTKKLEKTTKMQVRPDIRSLTNSLGPRSVHFVVDLWTSRRRIPAIGIRIHYIDVNWKLQVATFALSELSASHTGENIKVKFDLLLRDLEFQNDKMGIVVSDNGENIKKAFNLDGVIKKVQRSQLKLWEDDEEFSSSSDSDDDDYQEESSCESDFDDSDSDCEDDAVEPEQVVEYRPEGWSGCLAHTLQNGINESLSSDEDVVELLNLVNRIVMFFRHSNKWEGEYRREVNECCKCNPKPPSHDLKVRNTTRWNSTLFALERLSKHDVFKSVQSVLRRVNEDPTFRNKNPPGLITNNIHASIEELCRLLKPFQVLTDRLQSDHLTSNIVILSIIKAYKGIMAVEPNNFSGFKTGLLHNVRKRLDGVLKCKWFVLGALLDPRQKLKPFRAIKWTGQESLPIPTVSEVEALVEEESILLEEWSDAAEESVVKELNGTRTTDDIFSVMDDGEDDNAEIRKNLLSDYHKYVSEPVEKDGTDPLQFWALEEHRFKYFSKLARQVLSIPASSGSVERLFSMAGALNSATRANLRIEVVEGLIMRRESDEQIQFT